ncbi:MAG: hypothetical protein IIC83_09870 [Chloroflexi bacterium]|nr:hypothetical protein [Chloroflexota bacterium]
MARVEMLKSLAGLIADVRRAHPVRDAIDGIDASGKTTLADVVVNNNDPDRPIPHIESPS